MSSINAFHELSFYTLAHHDKAYFIHQHVVDAFKAQTADRDTKPIGLTFALIGLFLYLEKGYTGKQVQLAHMQLAKNKRNWTILELPRERGNIMVTDVLKANPGLERDLMIKKWCESVWDTYKLWHQEIANLAKTDLGIEL